MIFVDPRAGSEELIPLLSKKAPVTPLELEAGDVMFFGHSPNGRSWTVAWEVKKVPDLLQSLDSGRLLGIQVPRMRKLYDLSYLMVINAMRPDEDGVVKWALGKDKGLTLWHRPHGRPYTWAELMGQLYTLQYKVGVPWTNVVSNLHAAEVIAAQYHWFNTKEWEEHRSHIQVHDPPELREASDALRVAYQMPGIGMEKAKRIEEKLQTPGAIARATRETWMEIEGIGKKMAEKLERFWS